MEEGLAHGDQAEEGLQLEDEVKGGQRDVTLLTSDPSGIKAQKATGWNCLHSSWFSSSDLIWTFCFYIKYDYVHLNLQICLNQPIAYFSLRLSKCYIKEDFIMMDKVFICILFNVIVQAGKITLYSYLHFCYFFLPHTRNYRYAVIILFEFIYSGTL